MNSCIPRSILCAVPLVLVLCAAGCASEPKAPVRDASSQGTGAPQSAAVPARQDTFTPTSGSIHIEDRIMKACGDIPEAHFAFDSAKIEANAAVALDKLAHCFVSGPLQGHNMKLIGHADPRGETEYNFALGQRRAGSVEDYLAARGLAKARIATSSRGAQDATGTDEAGWARDRKVDVFLAD